MGRVPCMTNLRALCAWVIRWHVTCMLSLAEHWQGRRALSNHVCAHSVISMWHVVCLQHLARACSEQSRSTTVLPINHVIQMPQCLSGFVNHDYWTAIMCHWCFVDVLAFSKLIRNGVLQRRMFHLEKVSRIYRGTYLDPVVLSSNVWYLTTIHCWFISNYLRQYSWWHFLCDCHRTLSMMSQRRCHYLNECYDAYVHQHASMCLGLFSIINYYYLLYYDNALIIDGFEHELLVY